MARRRSLFKYAVAGYAALRAGAAAARTAAGAANDRTIASHVPYKRIATEEAWTTPEIVKRYGDLIRSHPEDEPGFLSMGGFIYTRGVDSPLVRKLQSLDEERLADMDELGMDMQLLSLTAPGVQVFDAATGTALAADSNDQLAEAIRKRPGRFAGLAAVAPQDPQAAAKEIERGVNRLGLNGVIINSHTRGEYLDREKYWDIFAAAEAAGAPIYIHPRTPSPAMLQPYLERHLDMAILGFGHEVAFHVVAIITAGVFDRFPDLKIVIGHLGEGLPYHMYRMDVMQENVRVPSGRGKKIEHKPSYYMKNNIWITTSGVAWEPAIRFAQQVLGADRVLYAMDYPYQPYPYEVAATDHLDIAAREKKMLFQDNAEAVFGIRM